MCIWKLLLLVLWWLFKFTNFSWSRSACYGLTRVIVENLIFLWDYELDDFGSGLLINH